MSKISVIVPIYNVDDYLYHSIKSILAQSFENFELILINDGSLDLSGRICDEFALIDSRIEVINRKNAGVSTARNNGVILATGDFVVFVDSDDFIESDFLQKLYCACIYNDAQMSFCDYVIVNDEKREEKRCITEKQFVFSREEAIEFYAIKNLKNGNALFRSPWAKLVRRETVLNNLFPTDRNYAEDAACIYRWIWNSERIIHTNYCGYCYYQNSESICHKPINEDFFGNFQTEQEWITFFEKNHFTNLVDLTTKRYLIDAVSAYRESHDDIFLSVLRKGLRKFHKEDKIRVKGNEYYYELAYPKEMKYYWFFQALKSKLKGK